MADAETLINLEEHEAAVVAFLAEHDGRLVRDEDDPAIYWLDMRPRSAPAEHYYPKLVWRSYPHAAPSVTFADGIGGATGNAKSWPQINGWLERCLPLLWRSLVER